MKLHSGFLYFAHICGLLSIAHYSWGDPADHSSTDPNTVIYYDFESGTQGDALPSIVEDQSGNHLDGTAIGGSFGYNMDASGLAADLTGDFNAIELSDTALLHLQEFTIDLKFKADAEYDLFADLPGTTRTLLAKKTASLDSSFVIGYDPDSREVYAGVNAEGIALETVRSGPITQGEWYALTFSLKRDVDGERDSLELYLNAKLIAQELTAFGDLVYDDGDLVIGALNFSGYDADFRLNFDGCIDDVCIRSSGLTSYVYHELTFSGVSISSDTTSQIPLGPSDYMYEKIESSSGPLASILNFSSLESLVPEELSASFSDLELDIDRTQIPEVDLPMVQHYRDIDGSGTNWTLEHGGQVIARGEILFLEVYLDNLLDTTAESAGQLQITAGGDHPLSHDFLQEVATVTENSLVFDFFADGYEALNPGEVSYQGKLYPTRSSNLSKHYIVSFDVGEHGEILTGSAYDIVAEGADASPPEVLADAGYMFTGWDLAYDNITFRRTLTALYGADADGDQILDSFDPDVDGDAIPDAWELQYFGDLTTADENSDFDYDGSRDYAEYLSGGHPLINSARLGDNADKPHPLQPTIANGRLELNWVIPESKPFKIQMAESLEGPWSTVKRATRCGGVNPMNFLWTLRSSRAFSAYRRATTKTKS